MNSLIKDEKNEHIIKEAELSQCFQLGCKASQFVSFKDFVFSMDSSVCDIASKSLKKNDTRKCLSLEDEFEVLTQFNCQIVAILNTSESKSEENYDANVECRNVDDSSLN